MKTKILFTIGAALILSSCGSKKNDNTTPKTPENSVSELIRGTTWEITPTTNEASPSDLKTTLEFHASKNLLFIKNSTHGTFNCGEQEGGEFKIVKSKVDNEYFINSPEEKCSKFNNKKDPGTMAIIHMKDGKITLRREVMRSLFATNGVRDKSGSVKENYTKKKDL